MKPALAPDAHVLLLDPGQSDTVKTVKAGAAMAGLGVHVADSIADSLTLGRPLAVVIDRDEIGWAERAAAVRGERTLGSVPTLALARALGDLAFEEAFSVGIDDCSRRDGEELGRILRALATTGYAEVVPSDVRVVVADPDRDARLLIGRVFRNAGYDVAFAVDARDALAQAADPAAKVVVCAAALEPSTRGTPTLLAQARAAGAEARWIYNAPPKQMAALYARIGESPAGCAVHDAYSAPANLLFVANELVNRHAAEARRSERVLFGTVVRFRLAGRSEEHVGYCYNLSAGGLYVRTLAPPDRGSDLWLELEPPRSGARVHLEARAVWTRPYGPGRGATVPAGFGAEITGVTPTDAERYRRGYGAFVDELTALRSSYLAELTSARPPSGA